MIFIPYSRYLRLYSQKPKFIREIVHYICEKIKFPCVIKPFFREMLNKRKKGLPKVRLANSNCKIIFY